MNILVIFLSGGAGGCVEGIPVKIVKKYQTYDLL
jgi:hypothetical protein